MEAVEAVGISLACDPLHFQIETEVRRRLIRRVDLEVLRDRIDALTKHLQQRRMRGLRRQYPTRQQHYAVTTRRARIEAQRVTEPSHSIE